MMFFLCAKQLDLLENALDRSIYGFNFKLMVEDGSMDAEIFVCGGHVHFCRGTPREKKCQNMIHRTTQFSTFLRLKVRRLPVLKTYLELATRNDLADYERLNP